MTGIRTRDRRCFWLLTRPVNNAGSIFYARITESKKAEREQQAAYLAIIIGVLVAVSVLLAAAIFFMMLRHRQRKSLGGSPLPDKSQWTTNAKLHTTT